MVNMYIVYIQCLHCVNVSTCVQHICHRMLYTNDSAKYNKFFLYCILLLSIQWALVYLLWEDEGLKGIFSIVYSSPIPLYNNCFIFMYKTQPQLLTRESSSATREEEISCTATSGDIQVLPTSICLYHTVRLQLLNKPELNTTKEVLVITGLIWDCKQNVIIDEDRDLPSASPTFPGATHYLYVPLPDSLQGLFCFFWILFG